MAANGGARLRQPRRKPSRGGVLRMQDESRETKFLCKAGGQGWTRRGKRAARRVRGSCADP